ncbi:MAG: hypothetical protein LUE27_09380, partial [Clostridia bacterium]|nr:hypothetical protein [Clostridia bacterium]
FKYIRARIFNHRFERAKRKAGRMADLYEKPFAVIVFKGRPRVVALAALRKFIAGGHLKGVTVNSMNKVTLYRAYPHGRRPLNYVPHSN